MALGSHLITVRRLKKYIDDVIGKKANLPDTSKTIIGNISQINSDLSDLLDSVVPEDITVAFGSAAFSNKVTFCKRIGKVIFYNVRFTTGSATYPTSAAFVTLNQPSSVLPTDQSGTSMRQNGTIVYGTSMTNTGTGITTDNKIGIYSGATLPANTNVIAFGFIMLK